MTKLITPEIIALMKELSNSGMSQRNIALQLGISRDQVQHHLAKHSNPNHSPIYHPQPPKAMTDHKIPIVTDPQIRILNQLIDDLESRYKKAKNELEEVEKDFKKIKNERDDLTIQLKTFEAQKELEIRQITSAQKGGLNGLVDKISDPNVLANLPSIVQAFQMAMGKVPAAQQLSGPSIPLPPELHPDKQAILKFILEKMAVLDETKFTQLTTLITGVVITNQHDGWLTESYNAMTAQPPQPSPTKPN